MCVSSPIVRTPAISLDRLRNHHSHFSGDNARTPSSATDWNPMTSVLLLTPPWAPHADVIEPRRVRLRARVQARLRANGLDRALAEGVPPERSAALALRARRLVDPALAATLARAIQRVLRDAWSPAP